MMENSSIEHSQTNQQRSLQNFVYQIIRDRPWILIGGLWTIAAIAAAYGFVGVFSAGKDPEPQVISSPTTTFEEVQPRESKPKPTPNTVQSTPKTEKPVERVNPVQTVQEETFPVWLFAGIIFACGAGSLFVLNSLKPSNTRKTLVRSQTRPKPKPTKAKINSPAPYRERTNRPKVKKKKKKSRPPAKGSAIAKRPPLKGKSKRPKSPLSRKSSPLTPKPMITVLPPEEVNRLDQKEESLADMLDLRKQRSLSSLMDRQK
ncbi:hypothetical protein [Oscillatoria salina]|uniref:hypothetical protein n=1 Tax=Oscillatoria salina TaxID=331517 RepID=UPI0013BA1250|nr:hypothetical protein [Oscillatoria salina]MBZ8182868.1 hypothetical protein [Oscillatoria salina IIICB1]NET87076.1 hypothetical protein [Kamptonema sp. SIO1D9]